MLKPDATRIAWFLGLQRISHFPKYFMAPPAVYRRNRRSAASDLETAGKGVPSYHTEPAGLARSNRGPILAFAKIQRPNSPAETMGVRTMLPFVRGAASEVRSGTSPWRAVSNLGIMGTSVRASEPYIGHQVPARRDIFSHQESRRSIFGSGSLGFISKQPASLAPNHASSLEHHFGEFDPYPTPLPIAAGTRKITFGQHPHLPRDQFTLNEEAASRYQPSSSSRDGTPEGNQPQRHSPTVSTLHIDGSALGRWAVQHLERALGKPTIGMTGVDPRATIPRSRVAPF